MDYIVQKLIAFNDLGEYFSSIPILKKNIIGLYYRDNFLRLLKPDGTEVVLSEGAPGTYVLRSGDSMTGPLNMLNNSILNVSTPITPNDAVNKIYVDSLLVGASTDVKDPVRLATNNNIVLSGHQIIDGFVALSGDRVLVKDQINAAENGIYIVDSGPWTRAPDANNSTNVSQGMFTFVLEGIVNSKIGFLLVTPNPITINTTPLTFVPYTSHATYNANGEGLKMLGNVFYIDLENSTLVQSTAGLKVNIIGNANVDDFSISRNKLQSGLANRMLANNSLGNIVELSALSDGQLFIGNTGGLPIAANLSGATNRINITNGPGSITISTPQDLHTGASPTFSGMTLNGFSGVVKAASGILSASALVNVDISNTANIDFAKMSALTANRALVSNASGVVTASAITSTELSFLSGVTFNLTSHGSRHNPSGADPISTAAPITSLSASTTNSSGSANSVSRSDHTHAILTGAPTTSLSATTTNSGGTADTLIRSDHTHAILTASPVSTGTANALGISSSLARADHVHNTELERQIVVQSGTANITSSTFVLFGPAVIANVSGTYLILINGSARFTPVGNNIYRIARFVIAINGNNVPFTGRSVTVSRGNSGPSVDPEQHFSLQLIQFLNANDVVNVRGLLVSGSGGTLVVSNTIFILIRLGD